jgi:hypothetical protein
MRLIVGESSTTKMLFILRMSGIGIWPHTSTQGKVAHGLNSGEQIDGGALFYGKVANYQNERFAGI